MAPVSEHCEEGCMPLTELQTTLKNGRWIIGVAGSLGGLAMMFLGWVANDNLAGIRSDMKEAKGMLQAGQVDMAKMKLEMEYLRQWQRDMDGRIKSQEVK